MYIYKTTVFKRGGALSLITLMLLSGCSSEPTVQQPQPQSVVQTTPANVLPAIDPATYHTVERGQTLFAIAQIFGRDYKEIAQWNNIPPPYAISPGQRLRIDGPNEGTPTSPGYEPPAQPTPLPPSAENTHTVQPGESLFGIATQYGRNYKEVAAWNQIESPYALRPGQILKLSPPPGFTQTPSLPTAPQEPTDSKGYHIVLQGDTLYKLARHYGYSVADIALWNGLQQPYPSLSLGQRLRISPPSAGEPIVSRPPTTPTSPQPDIMPFYTPEGDSDSGYHIVAGGDTLYSLSKRYNQKVADIALWNGLQQPYSLSLGQKLRVSPPKGYVAPAPYSVTPSPGGSTSGYHTVAAKETLYSISRHYGITVNELTALNGLQPPYPPLSLGQRLRVPPSTTRMKMPGPASDNGYLQHVKLPASTYHIVRGGETLRSIAEQYGIPFTDLASWNGIGSPYNIYPGIQLTLVPSR
jgi:peptidoglycan endopeptidase LytF